MTNPTQTFREKLTPWMQYFNSLFKPDLKYDKDQIRQEIAHTRNKTVFFFHSLVAFSATIQMITGSLSIQSGIALISATIIILSTLMLSWALHPEIFKIVHNITLCLGTLSVALQSDTTVHRTWIGVQIYPTLILCCSGSIYHFFFHILVQMIYLNTVYQERMIKTVTYMSPEDFTRSLTGASNAMCFINILVVLCLQISLQKAYDRISVAEQRKDEFERQKTFLLGFSHELRNLLNSLLGNIKLLKLESIPEWSKEYVKTADLCGELLLQLVNNILDTGKAEIGDLEVNVASDNLYQTVERAWNICSELIRRKDLIGRMKIQKNLPRTMKIDNYRLIQVFLNLIGNAVKFTDKGSINLAIDWQDNVSEIKDDHFKPHPYDDDELTEGVFHKNQKLSVLDSGSIILNTFNSRIDQSKLRPNTGRNKGLLRITVTDTGCGIDKNDLDHLFQKFTQVNSDLSRRKLGTGLGLFITKQLCEKMDGKIKVFSKKGEGSCFMVCMIVQPVMESLSHIAEADQAFENEVPQNLKALVVDDEFFSSHIIQSFLKHLKIEIVESAGNGLLGYKKFVECTTRQNRPHIITLDLEMPVLDGKKAAELIRDYETREKIDPCLLIIVSGNCSQSEVSECLDVKGRIRANAFVKKPANLEQLSLIISSHFSQKNIDLVSRNCII